MAVQDIQRLVSQNPYSIQNRLQLAAAYGTANFPDLKAGEAYKALLLTDEILDDCAEFHDPVLSASYADLNGHVDGSERDVHEAVKRWKQTALIALVESLLSCGCIQSAVEYAQRLPLSELPRALEDETLRILNTHGINAESIEAIDQHALDKIPDQGYARREIYPWNHFEENRFEEENLQQLNNLISIVAPRLEVRATTLPILLEGSNLEQLSEQLGVFAKEDIQPGDTILEEVSLLTANGRLYGEYCDACSAPLPPLDKKNPSHVAGAVECEDCQEIFCSQTCKDLAMESYHPALCDTATSALAKDAPAKQAPDALYALLLLRTLAMAETQGKHPLALDELRWIWGDFTNHGTPTAVDSDPPRTLPWSFKWNVVIPLNMLEKMDVNIFDTRSSEEDDESGSENPGRYDIWVFNTLYAKFRGTASARLGPDGRPEVGAVHPLWCLANHSCDPNVEWNWLGKMTFQVREQMAKWAGKSERSIAGLRKGDEVFGYYCDVRLNVQERREWAKGALGGPCRCPRCSWEEHIPLEE
ncbi:hypothetical protein P152DRAFT_471551 [Eremomyces bilateralis CBS 781.70]|uniref:SET domain-containing protein n=1 Tax=Eremomyces bilateralis CBS 781.70 TaxID=1392243 RepID=A0A6G1GA66_9PEZI|nr:uncharacterized protein P152DRAFT_471551 [Eremomyces bilateralis CBS 781.70]KAF1814892.1 hypothetical protein P152DRAFT_471551 [Eremomyces bilateralis CBS 781.70]